ncbi:MAG: hypothetical protein IJH05_08100 [Firmicutes bacterium]|nr:hypothetical protein [Bacillota bacterium]
MKGRFSKTGIVLVGCMLVCLIMFLAVGVPNGFFGDSGKGGDLDDDNTPKIGEVLSGSSPILVFDKSEGAKKLMTAFDEGSIESVELLYDEGGAGEPYETEDQTEIREIYKALKNITVTGESETSVTDGYHYVVFNFADGGSYGYNFEGRGILVYGEKNYEISGSDAFFDFVQEKCN